MFLQDFDLTFIHTPSTAMGPANTLSHLSNPNVSRDNVNVTLLPDDLFIQTINVTLTDKIATSSSTNPLVLDAV